MEKNQFLLACVYKGAAPDTSIVLAGGEMVGAWDRAMVHAEQTIELEGTLPNLMDVVTFYSDAISEVNWRIGLYRIFEKCLGSCTYSAMDDSLMIIEDGIELFADSEGVTVTDKSKVVYKGEVTEATTIFEVADVILKYFFVIK